MDALDSQRKTNGQELFTTMASGIQYEYNDLKKNFDEEHKKLFIKNVKFMLTKIT